MTKDQKDKAMYWLAFVTITYAFLYLSALLFIPIPKENEQIVNILSGPMILANTALVYAYFFATNKSSAEKTNIISRSQPIIEEDK